MELRKPYLKLLWVCVWPLLLGAAPSRTCTYTSGQIIEPDCVTENEDNIFSWAQAGVDTIRANAVTSNSINDGAIVNADISSSAAIAYSKLSLANSITGADIAVGSDTQGDVLYYNGTDWARLGVGTSGQFLKTNGAGANPSWGSSGISSKVSTTTRAAATASGTQAINGLGFSPTTCTAMLFQNGVAGDGAQFYSFGYVDSAEGHAVIGVAFDNTAGDDYTQRTSFIASVDVGGTDAQTVTIDSFDSDGYTLSWTKVGSGAAVIWSAICYR